MKRSLPQQDLFDDTALPEGFGYRGSFLSKENESALVGELEALPLKEVQFHGFTGKRRVLSFGWRYDFDGGGLQRTEDIPPFLLRVRVEAGAFAGMPAESLQHVLLTEYARGAAIGWHKDRSVFGAVVGISLLSACTFRLRRKQGLKWERASVNLEPRSAYLLQGPARTDWEHSIPAVQGLRYSITFRNIL